MKEGEPKPNPEVEKNHKREEMRRIHEDMTLEQLRDKIKTMSASIERMKETGKFTKSALLKKLELEAELLADIIVDRENKTINNLKIPPELR